jgi:hypothetical protein
VEIPNAEPQAVVLPTIADIVEHVELTLEAALALAYDRGYRTAIADSRRPIAHRIEVRHIARSTEEPAPLSYAASRSG